MNRYPKFKPSRIEWIGEIPEHWESTKLKYIGFLYNGLTGKTGEDFRNVEDPNNKPFIKFTNISNHTYIPLDDFGFVSVNEGEEQYRVQKNDLFFLMTSETQEDVGKTSCLKDDLEELYLNSFCKGYRITKDEFYPLFINYLLLGDPYRKLLSIEGKGFTRINLRQDKVNDFVVFVPPLPEQHQIVQFLDEKTNLIDRLISSKERKIELLKEQRTSLINQVVTKGLDPNVRMKDSGVEWIGGIPEHWKMIRMKFLYGFIGGGTPSKDVKEYWDGEIPWISPKDMKFKEIVTSEDRITKYGLENSSSNLIDVNSLLIVVRSGILQRTIPIGINLVPVSINQDMKSLRSLSESPVKFLYFFIEGNEQNLLKNWIKEGTTVESIEMEFMRNSMIPFPPIDEQNEIVDYLDTYTNDIDELISSEKKKIYLLKEYRQSLISEVVTGKVDVRNNPN